MNLDAAAAGGAFLVVSQFTLLADSRKGNRPSYLDAAPPETARSRSTRPSPSACANRALRSAPAFSARACGSNSSTTAR